MKRTILLVLVSLACAPLLRAAEVPAVTYYVQLIRGSDDDAPPSHEAHLIGAKLDHRLHNVFKWKNYWELKRETVNVHTGAAVRRRMSPQREVEINWTTPKSMMISIYSDGKLTRKQTQSIDTAFSIAGGDKDMSQPWFIIVRKDNPDATDTASSKLAATR